MVRYWKGEIYLARVQFLIPYIFILTGTIFYTLYKYNKYLLLLLPLFLITIWQSVSGFVFNENKTIARINSEIKTLEQKYPNQKFAIHYCDTDHLSRSWRDEYFLILSLNNKYNAEGIPLATWRNRTVSELEKPCGPLTNSQEIAPDLWDISQEPEQTLKKDAWKVESIESTYDRNVKWWYNEKP